MNLKVEEKKTNKKKLTKTDVLRNVFLKLEIFHFICKITLQVIRGTEYKR